MYGNEGSFEGSNDMQITLCHVAGSVPHVRGEFPAARDNPQRTHTTFASSEETSEVATKGGIVVTA